MTNKRKSLVIALIAALSVLTGFAVFIDGLPASQAAAIAQDDWKREFEDICSQTQDSTFLTTEELKGLIGRCETLRPRIEKLDETQKKIFLKRLQMCRDLFAYTLESKAGK
jgi:hypothetical protein